VVLWVEWPGILDILKCYTYHHGFIKDVRPLAKLWGKVIEEEVAKLDLGRPRGSVYCPTPGSILAWLGPSVRALRDGGNHPSRPKVAEAVGYEVDAMMYHVRRHLP
jgi:hypothetical protein